MTPCSETVLLRRLDLHYSARDKIMDRLAIKYRDGRLSAGDVCEALAALRAQQLRPEAEGLLMDCLAAVDPIPTTLWLWACRNADFMQCNTLRELVAIAHGHPRYTKHLMNHTDKMTGTVEGIVALMHESSRVPWALLLANRGVEAMLATR